MKANNFHPLITYDYVSCTFVFSTLTRLNMVFITIDLQIAEIKNFFIRLANSDT